jgi:hypothetical protein
MLFNLIGKNRRRDPGANFLGLIGSGSVPIPVFFGCMLKTILQTFLDTPESKTATITVTKTTTIV